MMMLQLIVLAVGFVALMKGADWFVEGSSAVAKRLHVPGLVTSIVAAKKGEVGMAVGNVVGSNIFNMMFILGISAMIQPVTVNMATIWDLVILTVISIIAYVFSYTKRTISRGEGFLMVLLYFVDVVFAFLR